MFRKDYILRLIEEFGLVLKRIVELKQNRNLDEALQEVKMAIEKYMGLDAGLIAMSSDSALLSLLTMGGQKLETSKCVLLAELLKEQGELFGMCGEAYQSYWSYSRSLALFAEALAQDAILRTEENQSDLEFLVNKLHTYEIGPSIKERLFKYYEATGRFDRAEDVLYELLDREPSRIGEARLFYERLSSMDDGVLEQGGLPRAEIADGMVALTERKKAPKSSKGS